MATGIISIAAFLGGLPEIAYPLFYLNLLFTILLVVLSVYRFFAFRKEVFEDFRSYQKGPGFFTFVAALCILGDQFILLFDQMGVAWLLLICAGTAWLIIGYGFFLRITITKSRKPLNEGISGSWLIVIVAIQALSSLTSLLTQGSGSQDYFLLFLALCLFLLGGIFYLYFMSLIIYRISFFSLNAQELEAPYWINMGATAITTLAGCMLILHNKNFHFIVEMLPFIKGFTLFFWAAGTWWIPLLVLLGLWRHVAKNIPVPMAASGYDPTYWGMVFPLGMYTVSTIRLSEALDIPFLLKIPQVFFYIAFFAWIAVLIGFLRHLFQHFRSNTGALQQQQNKSA